VSSKLSVRARNLSQRRHQKREGVDLAGQDQAMSTSRDSWVPADQHAEYADEDEEEEEEEGGAHANGVVRGREEERAAEA
jgi:hypothetical protein